MSRGTHRRTAAIAALGALTAAFAFTSSADAATYYACVSKKAGAIRLVSEKSKCKRSERKISFNSQGTPGKNGLRGRDGKDGTNGKAGTTGFTSTLPKGQTEVGTWGAIAPTSEAYAPISFNIPLATAPAVTILEASPGGPPSICPGNVAKPAAASGHLCIYLVGGVGVGSSQVFDPATGMAGAGPSGTLVKVTKGTANGTWAVTG